MKKRRFIPMLASAAMAFSMAAVPMGASAYGNASAENTTFSFNKYLVIDKNANVPNVNFTFTIAPDADTSTVHLTDTDVELYKGITGAKFDDDTAAFTDSSTTSPGGTPASFTGNTGEETTIKITDDAGKKYAADGLTVNFEDVVFPEPGVYRYVVTEAALLSAAYTAETEIERTLDVYVIDTDGVLSISGYVLYDTRISSVPLNYSETAAADGIGYDEAEGTAASKKSSGFVNSYETHDLTFGKEVTGNQGSKDKYFKYTVAISGAVAGDVYDVCVDGNIDGIIGTAETAPTATAATSYETMSNPVTVTVGEDGTVSTDFYLRDGQYITICGLGNGVNYSVSEAAENYTSTEKIEASVSSVDFDGDGTNDALTDALSGTIDGSDVHTGFTNDRQGTIPTGVILAVAGPAVAGIISIGGIAYLVMKNKKRRDEEEE